MKLFIVDSFTDTPFCGNPAGVCLLDRELEISVYRDIAKELNLSETAFVLKQEDKFLIKYYTPTVEVDLCGHATLASAKILFDEVGYENDTITFLSNVGEVTVKKKNDVLEMDFPQGHLKEVNTDTLLNEFVGETPLFVGTDNIWCFVEVSSEEVVRGLKPNLELLKRHSQKAFVIMAKSSSKKYDFVSRFFGPDVGIDEDPVTGSAHCYLAKYFSDKLNKNPLKAFQASERGGHVDCELIENDRVLLRGKAVVMSEIQLRIEP